jgi:hypothetical protein
MADSKANILFVFYSRDGSVVFLSLFFDRHSLIFIQYIVDKG